MRRLFAHRQPDDELRKSEARYRTVLDAAFDAIVTITPDGIVRWFNRGAERIFGYRAEEVIGQPVTLLMPERYRDLCVDGLHSYLRTGEARVVGGTTELVGLRKDGSEFPIEMSLGETQENGERVFTGVIRDVTERMRTEDALREARDRFRSIFDHAPIGVAMVSLEGRYLQVNRSLGEILGYTEEELQALTWQEITHPDDLAASSAYARRIVEGEFPRYHLEKRFLHADGHKVWASLSVSLVRDGEGEPLYFVSQIQDVSERKVLEERLMHQAFHDTLTGLPNRHLLVNRLAHALERTRRRGDRQVVVLFMDLDGFKIVNDSLGHDTGDHLLTLLAERLRRCVRPEDTLARFGGDEFVVLLEDVEDPGEAVRVAERITDELRRSFSIEGREHFVAVSIGIALGTARTKLAEDLLRDADTAMYRAKDEATDYWVFDPAMHLRAVRRLELENDLRRAVERNEFVLHYQPIVRLGDGGVRGVEALVRWHHPERGFLNPDEFVPVAEATGLVVPLGERVLVEACRQAKEWQGESARTPPLLLSVNLSAKPLRRPDLTEKVEAALSK